MVLDSDPLGSNLFSVLGDDSAELANSVLKIRAEFKRLDQNEDRLLNADEFLLLRDSAAELKRDFGLYDFDRSGTLSEAEFSAVSGLCPAWIRGSIPDPFEDLLDKAVAALDESYEQWNMRPKEYVNSHSFVANFIGSISPEGKKFVTGRILRQADPDGDGQMNRADARNFLTYQLGMTWGEGHRIREPTGRVLQLDQYLMADVNSDGSVTREEFTSHGWGDRTDGTFQRLDGDDDGRVTIGEYRDFRNTENYFDTVEWFRSADVDLSGLLDAAEIKNAVDAKRQHLVPSTIGAFDQNYDQLLSLQEFRLSMLGNRNYPWAERPVDRNRDGDLSYDEFIFHSTDLFQLQRRYYFHRLDRNRDRRLSLAEFEYMEAKPNAIRRENKAEGLTSLIYQDEEFPILGLPDLSPDGQKILFHRKSNDPKVGSQVVLSDLRGEVTTLLCSGSHPSWSPDGAKFVCARTVGEGTAGKQIWVMAADGKEGRSIGQGTAPCWSPDGNWIAFMRDNGIVLYDTASQKSSELVAREDHRYTGLGDLAWEPNSRRLALLATRPNFTELVFVPVSKKSTGPVSKQSFGEDDEAGKRDKDGASRKDKQVKIDPQRGFASCRSVGALSWGKEGVYFAIRPNVTGGVAKQAALQLWVPALNGGVKVVPSLPREMVRRAVAAEPDGKWYLTVSEH